AGDVPVPKSADGRSELGVRGAGLTPYAVTESLMNRYTNRMQSGKTDEAMRYAMLAESLWNRERVPAPVLLAIAATNRRVADELMGRQESSEVPGNAPAGGAPVRPLDGATRLEAKRASIAAGDYYLRHAESILSESAPESALSRWKAADSYD